MFNCVSLISNIKKGIPDSAITEVVDTLAALSCRVKACSEYSSSVIFGMENVVLCPVDELFEGSELIIVMGGDGSIISAARMSHGYDIPIVGINFGRLGYLAELETGDIPLLENIVKGEFKLEERMMLDVSVIRGGEVVNIHYPCLNETVLSNGPISRLAEFDLYCDGEQVTHYAADGIIISTPTGSSAYSLSAGGPLVYQTMECIIATPICPHSFTLRPVVFTGDSVLEIRNPVCRKNSMYITVDGRDNEEIRSDDIIRISKSKSKTKLVRVKDGGFISALNRKLGNKEIEI